MSPEEPQAHKSQRASSIAESQLTETVVTLKSEYAEGQPDSTLHEDTIEGWKQRARGGSRLAGTPELTDDATVGGQEGRIGDGPIFIKKSTEFQTSIRQICDDVSDTTYNNLNKTGQPIRMAFDPVNVRNANVSTNVSKKNKIHSIKEKPLYKRTDTDMTAGTERTFIPGMNFPQTLKHQPVKQPKGSIQHHPTAIHEKRYSQVN